MLVARQFEQQQLVIEYMKHRPRYTQEVFDIILDYMKEKSKPNDSGRFSLAIDVGCGPGLMSTVYLAPYFDRIYGVDVSKAQIDQAKIYNKHVNIEYRVAAAECLPAEDSSVSLVQSATALHWFDHQTFYKECDRVLVPGGVIAALCYHNLFTVVNHQNAEALNAILDEMSFRIDSPENPGFSIYNRMIMRKYTDPFLQIPYSDTTRRDDIYFNVEATIAGFKGFFESIRYVYDFLQSKPEVREWWDSCFQRIMECCGAEDLNAPLTYRVTVFMLLGRKPLEAKLSSVEK